LEPKDTELADRFKTVLDEAEAARAAEAERRQARLASAAPARDELFARLVAFAESIGHIAVARDDETVVMRYQQRGLRFEAEATGDGVRIVLEGWPATAEHRIYREADLADRWVLAWRKYSRDEKMPLFDKGLEELMVEGLGLPRPDALPEQPMSPRTARAMLGTDRDDEPPLRVIEGRKADTKREQNDEPAGPKPKTRRL
jgi:hypothetical protein